MYTHLVHLSRKIARCRQRLHFLGIRPHRRESPHVEQVPPRKASWRTDVRGEILRDPPNYVIAPAAGLLLVEDVASDRPIQHHELGVDRSGRAGLRLADALFQALDQLAIGRGRGGRPTTICIASDAATPGQAG